LQTRQTWNPSKKFLKQKIKIKIKFKSFQIRRACSQAVGTDSLSAALQLCKLLKKNPRKEKQYFILFFFKCFFETLQIRWAYSHTIGTKGMGAV
jgi:hypothetical protein